MTDVVLRLDEVTRVYGAGDTSVCAVDAVTLHVNAGELVAIMGPSGAGKTTLLALAGGLDVPTSGSVYVEDVDLAALSPAERARLRRDRVGYVFQDLNLVSSLTALENVSLPRELAGVPMQAAQHEAHSVLVDVGLGDVAGRFPDQLSGGQQQRVAIARALIGQRRLLLADEPTGALDTQTGQGILDLIRARVDMGAAAVMVTHEMAIAKRADQIIYLRDGQLLSTSAAEGHACGRAS